MDIGNPRNIHPTNKREVGRRLALWALAKDYGKSNIVYSGPLYKALEIKGDKAIISYDHVGGGLMSKGTPITHFEIAGADKKFYPAAAEIKGKRVIVASDFVKNPVAVRYAFHNTDEPNLFNKEGLPASSFRTDNWPIDLSISGMDLGILVKEETRRSWEAYKKYAWGSDVLLPLSKSSKNWYKEPLYISPIDAYSTLKVMGLEKEAKEIEEYVIKEIDFNKDVDAKIFEVNIRVLGGLLAMYQYSGREEILAKAEDFGKRMLPAFNSPTGIPYYWVNLKTGEVKGEKVNIAEAGSYTFEMGILSYFTKNPIYYQAAKKATKAVFERRSKLDLVGEVINVETGEWLNTNSHICAGIDSYYEYMYKSWMMFHDVELKQMWDISLSAINKHLPEIKDSLLWYGRVNMDSGMKTSSVITLYDAFFPAILAVSGDIPRAKELQKTWEWLWDKYGLEPMIYDYEKHVPNYPVYDLNPEIIESAYYLYSLTGDRAYYNMGAKFFRDIYKNCRNDVAFSAIEDVQTMEKRDYLATYFFAETMKYFYLLFTNDENFGFDQHVFSTEAHPFNTELFEKDRINERLAIIND
jgi:mannosidase alpha-like ER degradation enhancer 1/mannosidase alpha-like ER degradation enhancer 2